MAQSVYTVTTLLYIANGSVTLIVRLQSLQLDSTFNVLALIQVYAFGEFSAFL